MYQVSPFVRRNELASLCLSLKVFLKITKHLKYRLHSKELLKEIGSEDLSTIEPNLCFLYRRYTYLN